MKLHAFIAMPFGTKPGHDGQPVDFNRVYAELLKPALESAGLEVFRADEEQRAGDIRKDMFQELLIADLVVVDLTLDNPNVWYELGVRHALRARGVILVQGPRPTQPFDIYTDRKRRYSLKDGAPDPATLEADRAAIALMASETLAASTRRRISPVFALLDHLQEPEWQSLLLAGKDEAGEAYRDWTRRQQVARRKNRPGDILVLAGETPTRALRVEAFRAAGESLLTLQQYAFALEQFEQALAIKPEDKTSRAKRVVCLGRLGKHEDARERVAELLQDHPHDPECHALAGRVEKTEWIDRWRCPGSSSAQMRAAAALEDARLVDAIEAYQRAFMADPGHDYSGINALGLMVLREHLVGAEIEREALERIRGGVRWACHAALQAAPKSYWSHASQAELSLYSEPLACVQQKFGKAVALADGDGFALDSTHQTLAMLRDLEFRPAETAVALVILERELTRSHRQNPPRQVLLFSGHMVDTPTRATPRFPPSKVPSAGQKIGEVLDRLGAGAGDLALSQAAAGGDLLFLEACLLRGVRCQVLLPFREPEFIERSILPSTEGESWRERYFAVAAQLQDPKREMPEELGPLPKDTDPYERCNLWLLHTALAFGVDKVRFVCLWNGGGGDGRGGTAHMYDEIKRRTGRVTRIDPAEL